jgi:hypothetical protein
MRYYNDNEADARFFEEMWGDVEPVPVNPLEVLPSVAIKENDLQKDIAASIFGSENVSRYWRDDIVEHVAFVLESGSQNWATIYQELEDKGWKGRSVSLLKDLVEHFRSRPLAPAEDEIAVLPPELPAQSLLRHGECDGTIGLIKDRSGEIVSVSVQFPYNDHFVSVVKRIPGRKWEPLKKRWILPIESAPRVFDNFPHFQLSEGARALKNA